MKMCELKDGDCFYVPWGDWYGHVFEKNGVLYCHANFTEEDWILGDRDTEVETCRPRRHNIEWKLKQLGFKPNNEYDDYNRKILIINDCVYEVYADALGTEIKFEAPCSMRLGCEENAFRTSGFINNLNDIDGLYYAFETICKELAEYDLIWKYSEV